MDAISEYIDLINLQMKQATKKEFNNIRNIILDYSRKNNVIVTGFNIDRSNIYITNYIDLKEKK